LNTRQHGETAERFAQHWLESRGLTCIETNYHCRFGEIDLVMRDHNTVVFVEVRLRKHRDYGGAAASVDSRKQRKLRLAAEHYIATRGLSARQVCRIDVIALQTAADGWDVDWLENAISG